MPRGDKNQIMQYEFPLPPLETQRRIAAILSSLDDKIENNNRINRNLEAQAQALFKSWFVDFEPFGGVMPKDWKEGSLLDVADYLNGLAMQKFPAQNVENSLPVLKIKELGQKHCDESSDRCAKEIKPEYIIHDGDVIFSWSGTLLVDIWCGGDCGLNQHLFKVSSNKYPKWFYYLWTIQHLQNFKRIASDKAVTMGHIKRGDLDKSIVLIPNDNVLEKMTAIMTPLLDSIVSNAQESHRLAALRDTLLPKLMKGEIEL
jgi:type I restriction enzyme S subunit